MQTNAKNALDEAHQTLRELAMYLERVADHSQDQEQGELMKMAEALNALAGYDVSCSWDCLPTHAGNCAPI